MMASKPRTLQEIRKAELSQIHIAKKQLGWTEDEYRAVIMRISKHATESAGELNHKQRAELLWYMKSCGFKVRHARKAPLKRPNDMTIKDDRDQVKKIRWQWLDLFEFGAVRDNSERAMCAYIARVAKITVGKEHPKFLTLDQASDVIETLKKWQHRTRLKPFIDLMGLPVDVNKAPRLTIRSIVSNIRLHTHIDVLNCTKSEYDQALTLYQQKMKGAPHG